MESIRLINESLYLFSIDYMWSHLEDIVEDLRIPEGDEGETPGCVYLSNNKCKGSLLVSLSLIMTGSCTSPKLTKYCLRESKIVELMLKNPTFSCDSGNPSDEHFPIIDLMSE